MRQHPLGTKTRNIRWGSESRWKHWRLAWLPAPIGKAPWSFRSWAARSRSIRHRPRSKKPAFTWSTGKRETGWNRKWSTQKGAPLRGQASQGELVIIARSAAIRKQTGAGCFISGNFVGSSQW